jgi:hypothetical protein
MKGMQLLSPVDGRQLVEMRCNDRREPFGSFFSGTLLRFHACSLLSIYQNLEHRPARYTLK